MKREFIHTTSFAHHKKETQTLIFEQILYSMASYEDVTFLRFRGWALVALKALKSLSISNYIGKNHNSLLTGIFLQSAPSLLLSNEK